MAQIATYSRRKLSGNEGIFNVNGKDIYLPANLYWYIDIPNGLPPELSDSLQYEMLLKQKYEMGVFQKRFPKSSTILDPWLKRLQEYQDKYDSGKRFVDGVWMEKSAYEQQQAALREKKKQRRLQEEQRRKEAELRIKKSNDQNTPETKKLNKNKYEKNEFNSLKIKRNSRERIAQLEARKEAEKHRRELQISRDKEDEHLKIAFTVSSEERENLEKQFEERDKKRDPLSGERVKQIRHVEDIIQRLNESGNIAIDAKNNKIPEYLLFKTFIKAADVMGIRAVDGTRAIENARKSGFDMNELDLQHTLIYLCKARLSAIKEYPCIILFHHACRMGFIDRNKTPEIWKCRSIITDPEQGMNARREASRFLDNHLIELLGGGSYEEWIEEAKQTMTETSVKDMANDFDHIGNYKAYTWIENNLEKGMTAMEATDQEQEMLKELYLELGDYALMAFLDPTNESLKDLYEDIRLSGLPREKRKKYLNFDYVRIVRRYRPAVTSAMESKNGRAFLSRLQWMKKDAARFAIYVGDPVQSNK